MCKKIIKSEYYRALIRRKYDLRILPYIVLSKNSLSSSGIEHVEPNTNIEVTSKIILWITHISG